MNIFKNKKILTLASTLVIATVPIATVISCSNKADSAAVAQVRALLTGAEMKLIARQTLFSTIVKSEYKRLNRTNMEEVRKDAWSAYALNKMRVNSNYWVEQVNSLVSNGTINKTEFQKGDWNPAFGTSTPGNKVIKAGYFPSYEIAKEIIKNHKTLGWDLEITKLLMAELLFTTTQEEELYNEKEVKENSKNPNAKNGGHWFKEKGDEPTLLLRKTEKIGQKIYTPDNFFLNKYLLDKKPQLVWEKTSKKRAIGSSSIKLTNAQSFNAVNPLQINYLAPEKIFTKNITDLSKGDVNIIRELQGYKGFSTPAITDKGDVNVSKSGLKQRLKDNLSKSGFLSENGNLSNNANVIVKNETVTTQYVQQFLPHFVAFNVKSIKVSSAKNKEWVVDRVTGDATHAEITSAAGQPIVFKEAKYNSKTQFMALVYSGAVFEDKYIQLDWDLSNNGANAGKVSKVTLGDAQQMIKDKENLPYAEGNKKSFFYADTSLLANKDKLRKLIFQFALNDGSIINNAQKFMVYVRHYELKVNNETTREALKGSGLWNED